MSKVRFISFASPGYEAPMQGLLQSALLHGADEVRGWTQADVRDLPIYAQHRAILDAPRGAGYWAWKPIIILEELESLGQDDVLIYCDAGRPSNPHRVDRDLAPVVDWVRRDRGGMLPGVYIPQYGEGRRWTKGECFVAMEADTPAIRAHPQIQASFSIWQAHQRSKAFVTEWMQWCLDPRAIADERIDPAIPDSPDFVDHRHDQSVLTILALSKGLRCFGNPLQITIGHDHATAIDKSIGMLADRIAGRTWAVRRRIARDCLRRRDQQRPADTMRKRIKRQLWLRRTRWRSFLSYSGERA